VNRDHRALRLLLVTLLCGSCSRSKGHVCDGPTRPPAADEPCPPGTKVIPNRCPFESCRYCEKPDRSRDGPFTTWHTEEIRVEVMPDRNGHWGNYSYYERGRPAEAGWLKNGVRHGTLVRWYHSGAKALEVAYCDGALQHDVRRWSEQGAPLDAGAGWLAPPDGGL